MNSEQETSKTLDRKQDYESDMDIYCNTKECDEYKCKKSTEYKYEKKSVPRPLISGAGYAVLFAMSVCVSVIGTGYLTHHLLKVHYNGCLKVGDISRVRTKQVPQPNDCKAHFTNGALVDGVYRISPDKNIYMHVYCDMTNGGWTVIQRRINGNEDFDREWLEYVEGFGNLSGDHWIGLKYQHLLTGHEKQHQIAFDFLMTESKTTARAVYNGFSVGNQRSNFTMTVSSRAEFNIEMKQHVENLDFFLYHDDVPFTTKDIDNDFREESNCANLMKCGGYWYKNCYMMCLNGRFNGMFFFGKANRPTFFSTSVVKIRAV